MSTRAYKVIEIRSEEEPTFNVSEHFDFVSTYNTYDDDGTIIGFDKVTMEEVSKDRTVSKEYRDIAKSILKDLKGEEWLAEYICA